MKAGPPALITVLLICCTSAAASPPHIIFIYADDLGWNDVSFHGSPSIPTPNIDALAASGIALHNYYGEWFCTPSRGALLTAQYPIRLGFQDGVLNHGEADGLHLNWTTMPQHLKQLGYSTHMIGKWHLGFMTKEYTPTYRGFDSFYGFYNGLIDYYDYTTAAPIKIGPDNANQFVPVTFGTDLHNGTQHITDFRGEYATTKFTKVAKDIIHSHDTSTPLFLYFAHATPHASSITGGAEQAPYEDLNKFSYIKTLYRRIYAARMYALDQSIGEVFKALHSKDMLQNSVVIFASDNGGDLSLRFNGFSSNHPLRGAKGNLYEGGVRLPALVWSPLLELEEPRVSRQLMHVTDWLPTLYTAAGGNVSALGPIDGMSMWEAWKCDGSSPRTELLHQFDTVQNVSAYRINEYKVINGSFRMDRWYGPTGFEDVNPESLEEWVFKNGSMVSDLLSELGMPMADDMDSWYDCLVVKCDQPPPPEAYECDPSVKPCLFNIEEDPCEYYDLADDEPEMVEVLMSKIQEWGEVAVPPHHRVSDQLSDPACHNFTYVPWLDPEYYTPDCNTWAGQYPSLAH